GDEGKQSEHAASLDEDRGIADARIRVGEDGAVAFSERAKARSRRVVEVGPAKASRNRDRRNHDETAENCEHPAPAQEIADQAGEGRAEQVAGHRAGQRPADADLALLGAYEIAG